MDAPSIIVPRGQDPVPPRRSFSLKLRGGETGDRIMMFEDTIPAGIKSALHLHHDSDEVAICVGSRSLMRHPEISRNRVVACWRTTSAARLL
jgi:hypothetical protein